MVDPLSPATGKPMRRGMRPTRLSFKGRDIVVDMPGWYCDASDESVHSGRDLMVSDRALNRLKAEIEGLLPPEEIRRIRRKLGLTQKQAGLRVGGGPNAFQRYEAGDLLPSHALCSALRLLDRDPDGLAVLAEPDRAA